MRPAGNANIDLLLSLQYSNHAICSSVVVTMQDHATWSISLGRWGGVQVRLHAFFLLFAAFTLYLSQRHDDASDAAKFGWFAVASLGLLLASVLLHEVGHLWAGRRLGAYADQIVLGPFGGIVPLKGALEARPDLLLQSAGPIFNLGVCILCIPILLSGLTWGDIAGLLHPLSPKGLTFDLTAIALTKLAFWINWVLAIINLLPAFPFDGGRLLRAAILIRWPDFGRRGASMIVSSTAKIAAVGTIIVALVVDFGDIQQSLLPARYALILLAILLFFSARQQERREEKDERESDLLYGYDLSQELDDFDSDTEEENVEPTGPLTRWIEKRRELKIKRQEEIEQEEERRVDDILARLHSHGMQSLSSEDRALLERVSARYRSRLRN